MARNSTALKFTDAAKAILGPTRAQYIKLIGGSLPPACDNDPHLLKTEQMDGYKRQTVRLRVLRDSVAHEENPELQILKNLCDRLDKYPTDLAEMRNIYEEISLLDERIQYNFGDQPFRTEELETMDGVLEKFPCEKAWQYVNDLYTKTLAMYTHTEAFVLVPDGMKHGEKRPAILVSHQHNAQYKNGKSETVGIEIDKQGNPIHATSVDLVKKGYIVVAYDQLGFESRQHPVRGGLTWERWRSNGLLQMGKTLLRSYLSDASRVLDYMESRRDVDHTRLGAYGHSLGSWVTANLAVLDDRIKVAVANCGFPTTEGLNIYPEQYHCEPHSIPGAHKFGGLESVFSARKTPLALHMNFGGLDVLNRQCDKVIAAASAALGKVKGSVFTSFVDRFKTHTNSPEMLAHTLATFERALPVFAPVSKPANDPGMRLE